MHPRIKELFDYLATRREELRASVESVPEERRELQPAPVAAVAAFGRRAVIADLIIGAVLALIVFLLFSKLLTLSLPIGPLERLL